MSRAAGLPAEQVRQVQPLYFASGRTFGLLLLAFSCLFVLRRPDCVTNPQFWAEDGKILFQNQLVYGFHGAIPIPYRGYFPILGRLMAAPASAFPIPLQPLVYTLLAILIDSVCCTIFFLPRFRCFVESDLLRLALCLLAVTAFDSRELVGTLINAMWYVELAGILWILLPPQSPRLILTIVYCLVGLVIGASVPMLIIGLPIVVYHLVRREGIHSLAVAVGALGQTLFALFSSRGLEPVHHELRGFVVAMFSAFAYKVVFQAILGAGKLISIKGAIGAVVGSVLWVSYLWKEGQWRVLVPAYLIVASIALPLIGRDEAHVFTNLATFDPRGERYFLLGSCIFAYFVACTLERFVHSDHLKAFALLAVFTGGILVNFRIEPLTDCHWQENARYIEGWVTARNNGDAAPGLMVPINPPNWVLGAYISLPQLPMR
jgi:hypothetical protein